MKTITITLGTRSFDVPQLTLRQIRDLAICVNLPDAPDNMQEAVRRTFQRSSEVISAGLIRMYPDMTPDAVLDIEATNDEMRIANDAILRHSGLIPATEVPTTEGEASGEATGAP